METILHKLRAWSLFLGWTFRSHGASSAASTVGSMLRNSAVGWLVGFFAPDISPKLLSTLSFFFFFFNVYPDITYSQSFLSLCGYFCFLWGLISFTHPINTGIPHIPSIPLNECSQFPLVATTTNAQIIHTYLQVRALLLWALDCINS